jgi:hypothetical protein
MTNKQSVHQPIHQSIPMPRYIFILCDLGIPEMWTDSINEAHDWVVDMEGGNETTFHEVDMWDIDSEEYLELPNINEA